MSRRSGRSKSRAWIYASDSEPPTPPNLDYSDYELTCRVKRSKKLSRRFGNQRGVLKILTKMPLDVLFEIFSHLHPLDILHLSRTTKRLRDILMCRSARSVWKAAFSNVPGLPFCPSDLNEPQYANLAFDEHCHFCHGSNVRDIFWTCRVRCCSKCIYSQFIPEFLLERMIKENPEIRRYEHNYLSIFPYIVYPKPRRNRPGRIMYYLPAAEKYINELSEIKQCEMPIWRHHKRTQQTQRLTHAALCESWSIHWVYQRSHDHNTIVILLLLALLAYIWRNSFF